MPTAKKPTAAKPTASRPARRAQVAAPAPSPRPWWRLWGGVPGKQLMQFTGRLETLVNAGLPLVRCLRILVDQLGPGPLRNVADAVADDVESGAPLSEALAKYPDVFDRLYVNMVRAGEAGGVLGTILARLAAFQKKSESIKRQIRAALTYPVLVLCFAGVVLVFAMLFVVPKFEGFFASEGAELPRLTSALFLASRVLVEMWYLVVAVPLALVLAARLALRSEAVAWRYDQLKLALPWIGTVMGKTIVARFARTLGTLLASGVPILEALSIVRASMTNRVVADAVADVRDAIREGETMARPLSESTLFDDVVVNMIDVGEETGQLDTMLMRIADEYEDEADTSITVMFRALEPIMLLGVALVVGLIAFALYSPMVRLMESFTGG